MADDPNLEPGKSINIATGGLSHPAKPITIATDGFIVPIVGDIIFGGNATVIFNTSANNVYDYFGGGGLFLDGQALVARSYLYLGTGSIVVDGSGNIFNTHTINGVGGSVIGGAANVDISVTPTAGGQLILGGGANISRRFHHSSNGGIVINGDNEGTLVFNPIIDGGLTINGNASITSSRRIIGTGGLILDGLTEFNTTGEFGFGRGGASSPRRVPRLPNTEFEFPVYEPDDYLEPMDYLKKVQDYIDKAELEKQEMFKYLSKGTVKITGRGKIVAVFRDQPAGNMVVADNPPLEPIILDLPSVFNQGSTALEIAELEDHLLLNDLFGLGDYKINKGQKSRFVHSKPRSTGGSANVSFVSGSSAVKHVNIKRKRQQMEDDELMLNMDKKRIMSQQERDEEELKLLGLID